MAVHVVDTFTTYQAIYGAPRIAKELNELGVSCSLNYVADLLKTQGLRAHNGKSFNYGGHALTMNNVADNLLKRKFDVAQPNRKWVSDITYIWVEDQWLYLATVMDLFSRKIIGWSLDDSMSVDLVTNALKMALNNREIAAGLILHSDRGTQYRSNEYIDFMRANGCEPSMSRKGNCWDNAVMESFYSRLKVELIYPRNFSSISKLKSSIFEYIEIFYNRIRRHSANDYMSPAKFEEKYA